MEVVLALWHSNDKLICFKVLHTNHTIILLKLILLIVSLYKHPILQFLEGLELDLLRLILALLNNRSVFVLLPRKLHQAQKCFGALEVKQELPRDVLVDLVDSLGDLSLGIFGLGGPQHLV